MAPEREPPAATIILLLLQRVDPGASNEALVAWAATHATVAMIVFSGKELRGAKRGSHDSDHLMSALNHETFPLLSWIAFHAKTNEFTRLQVPLEELGKLCSRMGGIVTINAPHTQAKTAHLICDSFRATIWKRSRRTS